jgi:hypothetical protein
MHIGKSRPFIASSASLDRRYLRRKQASRAGCDRSVLDGELLHVKAVALTISNTRVVVRG